MSEINIPMELVASVLGTDPGVLAESLKSADGNLKPTSEIEGFLKEHFGKKLNEVKRSGIDEGYGRGKKESLTSKEKELAQKFEISDYQGFDGLFQSIARHQNLTRMMYERVNTISLTSKPKTRKSRNGNLNLTRLKARWNMRK